MLSGGPVNVRWAQPGLDRNRLLDSWKISLTPGGLRVHKGNHEGPLASSIAW